MEWFDHVVLVSIILISVTIGSYSALKAKLSKYKLVKASVNSVDEYLTATASMGIMPITFSLMASFFSATGIVGTPSEVYMFGVQMWLIGLSFSIPSIVRFIVTSL